MADKIPQIPLPRRERKKVRVKEEAIPGNGDVLDFFVKYRNIKYPRLEFKTGTLELILPFGKSPMDLVENHKQWILKKQKFIKDCLRASRNKKIVDRTNKKFQNLISNIAKSFAKQLKVQIGKIFYRRMRTKWASCSSKRNLTINTLMKYLPKKQVEYIIYHELVHLIEKRHNEHFWKLVTKRFRNWKTLESSLFSYWFLLMKYRKE
jgi:predicted metal-dependent hydrolase